MFDSRIQDRRRRALVRLAAFAALFFAIDFAIYYLFVDNSVEDSMRAAVAATTGAVVLIYAVTLRRSRGDRDLRAEAPTEDFNEVRR